MDFEYTPEQIHLRKAVREFAEAEIAPHVMEWDEAQTFPLEVIRKLGKLGYMGAIFPEELGGAGTGLHRVLHHHRRALARGWLGGHHRGRPHVALLEPHFQDGQRRAAEALPSQAGHGRVARLLVADRARGGQRRRRHAHARRTAGRHVGAQRVEDVHHQCALRRSLRGHGGDGSRGGAARHLGLRHRKGHAGLPSAARRKTSWACAPAPPAK